MTVPDEAVEAAARGLATHKWPTAIGVWESFGQGMKDDFRDQARAALEAAAPFIAAQALSEAADKFHARLPDGTGNGRAYNSYQVAQILHEQAESVRSKA
jgi:hypothetical protein